MAEQKDNHAILYKLLIDRRYRALRHIILIFVLLCIALNYAIPYDHFEVCTTPLFICYTAGIFLSYLLPGYFNFYFLMPRYLLTKRYLTYFQLLSLLILFILVVQFFLEDVAYAAMEIDPHPTYNFNNNYILILDLFGNYFLNFIAFTGCSVTLLLRYWITDDLRAKQLEKEHLQTEVEHLKQQVNPNFLYNTLHRIAQLGETNPLDASSSLMKFSKLLRYQLYDSSRNEVFLSSEIQFLHDYLKLEQLYYRQLSYEINTQGDMSCVLVAPLLFTPFVRLLINGMENPDKHGNLSLSFSADEEKLLFTCVTDLPIDSNNDLFSTIRQRLSLLFGKAYSLQVLPPPFIIPDGHIIALTLHFNEEV